MKIATYFTYIIFLLLLSGCATFTPSPPTPPFSAKKTSHIQAWTLTGAIGVIAGTQGGNASLVWKQLPNKHYSLDLFGPLGLNRVQLIGTPSEVTLTAGDQIHTAATAEELLEQQLGWPVPVSYLFYWVRGLPVPTLPGHVFRRSDGSLTRLQQQDWIIQYLNYEPVQNILLPSKIYITHPKLKVRLVIKQWQIP